MTARNKILRLASWLWGMALLAGPLLVQAQLEYKLLRPLPGFNPTIAGDTSLVNYLQNAFYLIIGFSALAAILLGVIYGFEYIATSAAGPKSEAKKHLLNIGWGLGLLLVAYLILYTINPALLRLDAGLAKLQVKVSAINNQSPSRYQDPPAAYGIRQGLTEEETENLRATASGIITQVFDSSAYMDVCTSIADVNCRNALIRQKEEFTKSCNSKTYARAGRSVTAGRTLTPGWTTNAFCLCPALQGGSTSHCEGTGP